MNLFISLLKSQKIMIGAGIILVIILIFVFGGKLGFTTTERILISALVLLLYFIWYLFAMMKEAKSAGNIEHSIGVHADNQMQSLRPEKKAEIEQFKKQLKEAINSLKKSKLGRWKIGKSALYALPWYMFIGPPASGKTTAIQNSGLEFPFGNNGLKGVGGTRNCDWFFSNQAIFLDTAGRYTTELEDRDEWISFLEILKKNRKKKPINGVLIGIGIDEIINSEHESLEQHAKNIRQRIDELIEHLGIRFPVYLVFTKCDLLQGFAEYFGDFSHGERSQIWGSTFTREQQNSKDLKNVFHIEFEKLYNSLTAMQRNRLSLPLKREQRRRVYLFPHQFSSLKEKLNYFVGELFQPNPYQDSPIIRGFYFTSGTQEGRPLNLAIEKIAKQFNLPALSMEEGESELESKTYFIRDLFTNILIKDQNYLVGQTSRIAKQKRFFRYASIVLSTILLGLFILGVSQDYVRNQIELGKISESVENIKDVDWNSNLLQTFKKTDKLRTIINQISNEKKESSIFNFGLNRSAEILEPVKQLYFSKTKSFFNNYIYGQLEKKLREFVNGKEYPREKIYNTLKTYLLVGDEFTRLDTNKNKFLFREFSSEVDTRILKLIPASASSEKEKLRVLIHNHIRFTIKNLGLRGNLQIKNTPQLVKRVRNLIRVKPSISSVYNQIKRTGFEVLPEAVSLRKFVGTGFSSIIKSDYEIPTFFTKNGWTVFVKNEINNQSNNTGKNDWVLGNSVQQTLPKEMLNKKEMSKTLQKLYFTEYNKIWRQFIRSIDYSNFGNVSTTAQIFSNLSNPENSPLVLLMKKITQETTFNDNSAIPVADSNSQSIVSKEIHPVDKEFSKLHNFVFEEPSGEALGEIAGCLEQYSYIAGVLESLKGDTEACKNYSAGIIKQGSGELPTAMKEIKNLLYPSLFAIQKLFETPVRNAWRAIMNDTQKYLNDQWQSRVYEHFNRTLVNNYPFSMNNMDAPLEDFEDFFNPRVGVLATFFNDELADFVNKNSWRIKKWENINIKLSRNMINTLKLADDIGKTMFNNEVLNLSFQMKPLQPVSQLINGSKPIVEQTYLYINGIEDKYYSGSPYWIDIDWPVKQGGTGAKLNISIRNFGSGDEKSFDGEWALFRLLDLADIGRKSSRLYQISWNFSKMNFYNIRTSYELRASSAKNPFKQGYLKQFHLPEKIN
ncbi:MAG: type VI secretion system membrane subunit TssM [Melioribacteraceae bacterium]